MPSKLAGFIVVANLDQSSCLNWRGQSTESIPKSLTPRKINGKTEAEKKALSNYFGMYSEELLTNKVTKFLTPTSEQSMVTQSLLTERMKSVKDWRRKDSHQQT